MLKNTFLVLTCLMQLLPVMKTEKLKLDKLLKAVDGIM